MFAGVLKLKNTHFEAVFDFFQVHRIKKFPIFNVFWTQADRPQERNASLC